MPLSVGERQARLEARFPAWTPRTLDGMLRAATEAYPARPFVITDRRTWTYADMLAWTDRIAGGLRRLGVRPGDHVAIILANQPEFIALKFAIARVGAVAVPINVQNRRDEIAYLLHQSDAALLVTMDRFRDVDYLAALDELAPGWERAGGGDAFPRLRDVVVLPTSDVPLRTGVIPFMALEGEAIDSGVATADPASPCDIIYTSGTTGAPKGVLLSHDMLLRAAYGSAFARAFEDGRRILFSLPMYHVYGYVEGLLSVLFVGGAIIPQIRFDPVATLRAIETHRATDILLVPTMTLAVIDAAEQAAFDLSSLRHVLSSGGRAPERIWQAIRDVLGVDEITTGYGMTEATASTTVTRPDDPDERLLTTNGRQRDVGVAGDRAIGGRLVAYRVIDPADGADVPAGMVGELVAKGPGITAGYYNKPEATAAAFTTDGWLLTGDLGRIDADGYISLVGRSKESYRCGGEQVLPTEIEDLLTSHPEVLQAHVVPVADARMGEVGVAFVVTRPGAQVTVADLIALVAGRLARFKVPKHVALVAEAEIPTTASGRARKFLLAERAARLLEAG